jgi:hypothetical protein
MWMTHLISQETSSGVVMLKKQPQKRVAPVNMTRQQNKHVSGTRNPKIPRTGTTGATGAAGVGADAT